MAGAAVTGLWWHRWRAGRGLGLGLAVVLAGLAASDLASAAAPGERVFTVRNYPVEAIGPDAVAAKTKALEDGKKRAFRSLMKRLVPVTEYGRLDGLKDVDARRYVASVGVRSEGRPSKHYVASYDFAFMPDGIRQLLAERGVPYVEAQAPATTLVIVYVPPTGAGVPASMSAGEAGQTWASVWRDLDLANTLAPLKPGRAPDPASMEAVAGLTNGDLGKVAALAQAYKTERVVLALAAPDLKTKRLRVVLAGRDAVGDFHLSRAYRIFDGDMAYTLELAAVVGQGILEGRWKAINAGIGGGARGGPQSSTLMPVQIWVDYQSFSQWRSIQQVLNTTPGVTDFRIGGQSARGASVALRYPGGGEALGAVLFRRGLSLENQGGTWVLR